MSPKDALRKFNAENPTKAVKFSEGRGRLSREAVDVCTKLAGKGWAITGYVVQSGKANAETRTDEVAVKKVAVVNEKVIHDFVIFYDENSYNAVDKTGKVWSMRNCCNTCGVSLVQDHCGAPVIFGDIPVSIVPK